MALAVGSLAVGGAVVGLVLGSVVCFDFFMALSSAIEDLALYGAVFFRDHHFIILLVLPCSLFCGFCWCCKLF